MRCQFFEGKESERIESFVLGIRLDWNFDELSLGRLSSDQVCVIEKYARANWDEETVEAIVVESW